MSYILYVAGFVIVIGGLCYGAALLHVPAPWIMVVSIILLGIAIITGVKVTRQKDRVRNRLERSAQLLMTRRLQ